MTKRRWIDVAVVLGGALALAATTGCKRKKSGGGTGGGGAWLVGDDGLMINVLPDGALGEGYDVGDDRDLLGITCRGADTAFVVGEQGTLLRTYDGGDTWTTLDLDTVATLRAVAAPRGEMVYVAGDGVLAMSPDAGDTWVALPGADRAWRSIATDHDGEVAVMIDDAGTVWRWAEGVIAPVVEVPGGRALASSHDGAHAVVVGDAGAMVRSDDGGGTWTVVPTGTTVDLHAAWATEAGELIAVGAAGTLVRARDAGVEVTQLGDAALRAVHVDDAGHGLVAGDAGEVLITHDGGDSWDVVEVGVTGTIRGLDSVDGAGHL